MKAAADQAQAGHGQIVAAMAEPGIRKSRLLFEFKAVAQAGWMVLETFSISHGKASAYPQLTPRTSRFLDFGDGERLNEAPPCRCARTLWAGIRWCRAAGRVGFDERIYRLRRLRR
jgi:hypothetical protein